MTLEDPRFQQEIHLHSCSIFQLVMLVFLGEKSQVLCEPISQTWVYGEPRDVTRPGPPKRYLWARRSSLFQPNLGLWNIMIWPARSHFDFLASIADVNPKGRVFWLPAPMQMSKKGELAKQAKGWLPKMIMTSKVRRCSRTSAQHYTRSLRRRGIGDVAWWWHTWWLQKMRDMLRNWIQSCPPQQQKPLKIGLLPQKGNSSSNHWFSGTSC